MIEIQPDKCLLFGFAKLQGQITPLRIHNVEEEIEGCSTTIKIKCHKSSQVGLAGTQSKAGGSACVGEDEERQPQLQGLTVLELELGSITGRVKTQV